MKILTFYLGLFLMLGLMSLVNASPIYKVPEIVKKEYDGPLKTVSLSEAQEKGCLSCHQGIESIRDPQSLMMIQIVARGQIAGDPGGCVVCHGGNPQATDYQKAHEGSPEAMIQINGPTTFYRDPGSIHIAEKTCGQCHTGYVYRLQRALMNTEAGKIQGNLHTWGVEEVQDYNVPWGNYDVQDTDGPRPMVGTEAYKDYAEQLKKAFPKQIPDQLEQIPHPTVEEIEANPQLAGFTYQRQQCQRCHVAVRGREKRGDYRGMGCSACHVLYGNEGLYEGSDPTIDKKEKGHLLTHKIYGTREAGGIPVETCNSCHNRGKRIGVTYQGLMEFPYGTPFNAQGKKQPKLHTKQYLFISDDLHHQLESRPENPRGGLLCQDCHTSIDMHGDGNIFGTTLAQVEIECQDCHGTTDQYPWELPLGYSEEFGKTLPKTPRGLAEQPPLETLLFGTVYEKKEGYLLSARGNPLGNVVKDGEKVILHSATGNDFQIPVLKTIKKNDTWKSENAMVAMSSVRKHNDKLECYTCHASWAPQCYGCHVTMDYSKGASDTDWIASGSKVFPDGQTMESHLGTKGIQSLGKAIEGRSYLRWEDPVLGINGEGRVTPLMPGCQVLFTVIGRDGKVLVNNMIASVTDEALAYGQTEPTLGIDMAPVQPHSMQRKARSCESCHNNPKALGYGIGGGVFQNQYSRDIVEDLIDQRTGEPIPKNYQIQIAKIPKLTFDWSAIIDKQKNQQLATVGSHWPLSRALNEEERKGMERTGLCMGCHREMLNDDVWKTVSKEGSLDTDAHTELMNQMLQSYYEAKKKK